MRKIIQIFRKIGKRISQAIVSIVLTIVYLIIIAPYSLFVRFNRKIINRNYSFNDKDCDRMF